MYMKLIAAWTKRLEYWRHEDRYPRARDGDVNFPAGLSAAELDAEHDRLKQKAVTVQGQAEAKAYLEGRLQAQQAHIAKHGTAMKIRSTLRDIERELNERKSEAEAWRSRLLTLSQERLNTRIDWPQAQRMYADAIHTMKTHVYNLEHKTPDLSIETGPLKSAQDEVNRRNWDLTEIYDSMQKWTNKLPDFSSSWIPLQHTTYENLRTHLQRLWKSKQEALVRHETEHLPRILAEEEEAQRIYRSAQKAESHKDQGM